MVVILTPIVLMVVGIPGSIFCPFQKNQMPCLHYLGKVQDGTLQNFGTILKIHMNGLETRLSLGGFQHVLFESLGK